MSIYKWEIRGCLNSLHVGERQCCFSIAHGPRLSSRIPVYSPRSPDPWEPSMRVDMAFLVRIASSHGPWEPVTPQDAGDGIRDGLLASLSVCCMAIRQAVISPDLQGSNNALPAQSDPWKCLLTWELLFLPYSTSPHFPLPHTPSVSSKVVDTCV